MVTWEAIDGFILSRWDYGTINVRWSGSLFPKANKRKALTANDEGASMMCS